MLYPVVKKILFSLPPETAHDLALHLARLGPSLGKLNGISQDPRLRIKVGNCHWPFPVGLAAGLDKNAEALDFFAAQGFGAVECGTVTLKPQLGNPRPRIFRYPEQQSLRNAMGFPNQGLLEILPRVRSFQGATPLGINIGKNKDSTPDESIEELSLLCQSLGDHGDYLVINVSSPNTPGLRALQEKSYLSELFTELNQNRTTDLYLKIAPDLSEEKIVELTQISTEFNLTGIIATNTTMMPELGTGGVSGALLTTKAKAVRAKVLQESKKLEVIGVGGIMGVRDLFDFWAQGGKAAQIYTGYIYKGPELLKEIKLATLKLLDQNHLKDLESFFALPLIQRQELLKSSV